MNCGEQTPQAICASKDLFGVTPECRVNTLNNDDDDDDDMITNHGNYAIFPSKEFLAFTPDNMGNRLEKGTYSMIL